MSFVAAFDKNKFKHVFIVGTIKSMVFKMRHKDGTA